MSLFKSTKQNECCPQCDSPLQIKRSKQGLFLGCSRYPACDYLKPLQQSSHIIKTLEEPCPECGGFLQIKQGRLGIFIGCSHYPACHFTVHDQPEAELHILCPECQTGQIVERVGRSGKPFYACDQYPTCRFSLFSKPIEQPCPLCHFPLAVVKKSRGKSHYCCANKRCQHLFPLPPTDEHCDV